MNYRYHLYVHTYASCVIRNRLYFKYGCKVTTKILFIQTFCLLSVLYRLKSVKFTVLTLAQLQKHATSGVVKLYSRYKCRRSEQYAIYTGQEK